MGLTPAQAVRNARTIAVALLLGQVALLGIAAFLIAVRGVRPADPAVGRTMFYVSVVLFAALAMGVQATNFPRGDGMGQPDAP